MDFKVIHIDETDSTNRWLREMTQRDGSFVTSFVTSSAVTKEPSLCVIAEYQTAGRGCGTNSWESERGKNLTFSLLIHPSAVPAAQQFILSMANALALRDTLADYTDDIRIKWPNDIYWQDKKICGTLIETRLQGSLIVDCIIGTGINVNQQAFLSDAPNPVSLCQILDREVSREEVLQKVLDYTAKYMEMVSAGQWEAVRTLYRHHLYRLEETWSYRFPDGSVEACKLVTVTDDGHLELLRDGRETYRMAFKEVQFII